MSTQYIGEIRLFGGNFAPAGWAFCDGSLLSISENDALFALIGTTYGGDGESTFKLPDLRGRLPVVQGMGPDGTTYVMGQTGGVEIVTLATGQMPAHAHPLMATSGAASETSPAGHIPARSTSARAYTEREPVVAMSAQFDSDAGGGQPHENMQPYLPVSFIIALFGVFPSQT